jgi:hypothetical protein
VRLFVDDSGNQWEVSVKSRSGPDHKGRHHFVARPLGGDFDSEVELRDIRWNSERTARRTLETMSEVELRRRLRGAVGRSTPPVPRR